MKRLNFFSFVIDLLIFSMLIYFWTFVHELFHILPLYLYGYKFDFKFSLILPTIENINTRTPSEFFLSAISPYILDIMIIFILSLIIKKKNYKILRFIKFIASFDIFVNFVSLIPALYLNLTNDFVRMYQMGYLVFSLPVVVIGITFFFYDLISCLNQLKILIKK